MNDFDFLTGTWDVANRWRADFLDESSAWEEFPAFTEATRHFGGAANVDEITFPTKGFAGMTLRLYNPATQEWSLYWASKRTGILFPPVTGRFTNGAGEFYGDDTHNGAPVQVRFIWSDITSKAPRWEQAYSADTGKTWITNWQMELTRRHS